MIALEIPWGGADGVLVRLNDGLACPRKPMVLVIGEARAEVLAVRYRRGACELFREAPALGDLLVRIALDVAARLRDGATAERGLSRETTTRTSVGEDVENQEGCAACLNSPWSKMANARRGNLRSTVRPQPARQSYPAAHPAGG